MKPFATKVKALILRASLKKKLVISSRICGKKKPKGKKKERVGTSWTNYFTCFDSAHKQSLALLKGYAHILRR